MEILKEKKKSVKMKCSCGKELWVKKGSNCFNKGLCVDCITAESVSNYNGEDVVILTKPNPIINTELKIGRNEQCTCFSGLKFKKCCGK